MTIQSPEALSLTDIIKFNVRALIRRFHLNRDWIIGLIGERGGGKSLGGSNIAVRDYGMNGEPLWGNMQIDLNVNVPNEVAAVYGLEKGGVVSYSSEYIDKQEFLSLDGRYEGGCLFFDEFNLEYGEARRAMANSNLLTDRAIQQLRKIQCGLVYTVLNEMYVDPRIRENTDVFIRCCDTALNPGALRDHKPQGKEFEWIIYPMSPKIVGNGQTYDITKKAIGPVPMGMGDIWGIIDTYERQAVGKTTYSEKLLPVRYKEDETTRQSKDKWAWLDKKIDAFYKNHIADGDEIEISANDLRQEMGIEKDRWGAVAVQVENRVPGFFLSKSGKGGNSPRKYIVANRELV